MRLCGYKKLFILRQGSVVSLHIVHFSRNKTLSDNEGKSVSLFPATTQSSWPGVGCGGAAAACRAGAGSDSSGASEQGLVGWQGWQVGEGDRDRTGRAAGSHMSWDDWESKSALLPRGNKSINDFLP